VEGGGKGTLAGGMVWAEREGRSTIKGSTENTREHTQNKKEKTKKKSNTRNSRTQGALGKGGDLGVGEEGVKLRGGENRQRKEEVRAMCERDEVDCVKRRKMRGKTGMGISLNGFRQKIR